MKKISIYIICLFLLGSCVQKKEKVKEKKVEEKVIEKTPISTVEKIQRVPLDDIDIPFKSSWSIITTDGQANQNSDYLKQNIDVLYYGENINAISLYREGIPFEKGGSYKFSFNVESTVNRKIELVLSREDGSVLLKEIIDVGENKYFEYTFENNKDTTWNGKISFNLGNDNSENVKSQHTVGISNILLSANNVNSKNVRVNQVGYTKNSSKKFVVPYNVGDYFNVVDVRSNEVVFSGKIGREIKNEATNETNYYGDFSKLDKVGVYRIETSIVSTSYDFIIEDNVYSNLLDDALKMMFKERSGYELTSDLAGDFARSASHTSLATVYGSDKKIDVSGGWYDAGDYGRYIKTGSKATLDLLLTYKLNKDKLDSGYLSRLLDEARFELEWMFKMQEDTGGVYKSVVSSNFADYLPPENDNSDLYVLDVSTNATGFFAGVMAYAYEIYKDTDIEFSKKCLSASEKAYSYLKSHQEMIDPLNPSEFSAGEYRDDNDKDERFLAAIALFNATLNNSYLKDAKEIFLKDNKVLNGFNWKEVGGYGVYIYLSNVNSKNDVEFYNTLLKYMSNQANTLVGYSRDDGYFLTILNNYNWGSNMDILSNAVLLILANDIFDNENYIETAYNQLNYILGVNSLNMSFVTGYGYTYPKNIHNRMTIAKNIELIGALVGGSNANFEDDVVRSKIDRNTPPAKVYIDDSMSYSTNEIAIYWNSQLVFVLSYLNR